MPPSEEYATTDLYLAGFLLIRGHTLLSALPSQPPGARVSLVTFRFQHQPDTGLSIQHYWNDALVPIGTFVAALTTLKRIIRQHATT